MKQIIRICLLILATTPLIHAQQTDTLKLDIKQTIQLALKNNPNLQRVKLNEELLERQIKTIESTVYPTVKGKAGYTDNFALPQQLLPGEIFGQEGQIPVTFGVRYGVNAGVEVNQLIFSQDYFANKKMLNSARKTYKLQTLSTMEDLIFNVAQTYIQYEITQEQKKILEANLDRVNKLVEISQAQYENGIIKKLDVDQLKVNRTNLLTELSNLEIGAKQQLNLLKFYLDIDQSQPISLSENLEDTNQYTLDDKLLLEQNLNYQLLQEQLHIAELDKDVIKAAYYPTVSAFAQYNYTGQSDAFSVSDEHYSGFTAGLWGLNVAIPIFDGFKTKRQLAENQIEIEQLMLDKKQFVNSAKMQYENAKVTIAQNETLANTQEQNMELAQELYDITNMSYQEGVAPLTELLNAETSLRESQSQYLTALLNLKLAELQQFRVSGKLAQVIQSN